MAHDPEKAGKGELFPMIQKFKRGTAAAMLMAACGYPAYGQSPVQLNLTVDIQNVVEYQGDIADPLTFAKTSGVTTSKGYRPANPDGIGNFAPNIVLGDIVAVNGQPVKGFYMSRPVSIGATPNAVASQSIADVTRTAMREQTFDILQADGTAVGVIMTTGVSGGRSAAGEPADARGAWAVIGGTGPFVGVRGQAELSMTMNNGRAASMTEDPSMRRVNGGGVLRVYLHVVPMITPQIVTNANGPVVVHSRDFTLVTPTNPSAAGETLTLFATGLGAVRGSTNLGDPFPSNPPAVVNSPVGVSVNGQAAELLAAVGYPGATDGYQVNFRMPSGIPKGTATLQLSAAWITGSAVGIPVQ
jgi:uncharacterized protein (TIGR03437 family)